MREILGKAKTVRELLKGVKYSIDYYQREYKWHDKQIRELVDDLTVSSSRSTTPVTPALAHIQPCSDARVTPDLTLSHGLLAELGQSALYLHNLRLQFLVTVLPEFDEACVVHSSLLPIAASFVELTQALVDSGERSYILGETEA